MLLRAEGSAANWLLLCCFVFTETEGLPYEYNYSGLSDFIQEFCSSAYNYSLIVGSDTSGIECKCFRTPPF